MIRSLNLRWRLAGAFFSIILTLVALLGLYLLEWTERYYVTSVTQSLRRESQATATLALRTPAGDLPGLITKLGKDLGHRVTVIAPDGAVIADSERDFRLMSNHADRPEFRQALATGLGTATRYSDTLKTNMLYLAAAFEKNGGTAGVVRVAEPLSGLLDVTTTIQHTFLLAGLVALVLAALLSLRLASGITRPIEGIASAARRLSEGDLSARAILVRGSAGEIVSLAHTFNETAEKLQGTIGDLTEHKARMQAIFDHTDDGLILVDQDGVAVTANPAARRMLGHHDLSAKTVIEGTLSHDLAGLVERVMRSGEPASLDVNLPAQGEMIVHAYVAPVYASDGKPGALVVMHDVTASRQLDAVRRDFVANVSHELRTPLAGIKAMAETILLRHKGDPSAAEQFAEKIIRQADRMTILADDLLDLAHIESGQRVLNPRDADLRFIVDDLIGHLRGLAETRAVHLVVRVPEDMTAFVDPDALAQILRNLLDNAVKYSRTGGEVVISAERIGDRVIMRIADNGIGIPEEELPRVFERFYRVDKDRSRQSGGTGLGLAIVKHLVELIGGDISVTSEVGEGTVFELRLSTSSSS